MTHDLEAMLHFGAPKIWVQVAKSELSQGLDVVGTPFFFDGQGGGDDDQ